MAEETLEFKYCNLYRNLVDLTIRIENTKRNLNGELPLGAQGPRVMDLQQYKEAVKDLLDVCEKGLRSLNQEIKVKAEENELNALTHQYTCLLNALEVSIDEIKARHLD